MIAPGSLISQCNRWINLFGYMCYTDSLKIFDARSISSSTPEHLRQLAAKAVLDAVKNRRKLPSSLELLWNYQPGALKLHGFQRAYYVPVFLEFLLLRQSDCRVYLIIDRHPVHRSHKVKNWVEENEDRLRLVFLPRYSPQINPDELLNQDIKRRCCGLSTLH